MVRSHTVLVLTHYPAKKSLLVVVVMVSGEWWQTKFSVSPGPGFWSLDLGPFGPDLRPDLDLTWDLDLDLSLTIGNRPRFTTLSPENVARCPSSLKKELATARTVL